MNLSFLRTQFNPQQGIREALRGEMMVVVIPILENGLVTGREDQEWRKSAQAGVPVGQCCAS